MAHMSNLNQSGRKTKRSMFSNPVLNHVKRSGDFSTEGSAVSYKGIALKCGIYLLMIAVGAALAAILRSLNYEVIVFDEGVSANLAELIGAAAAILLFVIFSVVCVFAKKTKAFFGSLYCICFGYMYAFLANFLTEYREPILLAIVVTFSIFAAVVLAYASGVVKLSSKFKKGISLAIGSFVIASLVLFVSSFIPGLNVVSLYIAQNPVLCILFSIVGIIIATLSLVKNVDDIQEMVEHGMSSRYEWTMAFSLIFSLVWVFVEIVELLINLKD